MERRSAATGILLALAACGSSAIDSAREIAAHDLADPAAAQFREVKRASENCVVGELNAKNRMGAYTGFRPFIVDLGKKQVAVSPDDTEQGDIDAKLAVIRIAVFRQDCGMR